MVSDIDNTEQYKSLIWPCVVLVTSSRLSNNLIVSTCFCSAFVLHWQTVSVEFFFISFDFCEKTFKRIRINSFNGVSAILRQERATERFSCVFISFFRVLFSVIKSINADVRAAKSQYRTDTPLFKVWIVWHKCEFLGSGCLYISTLKARSRSSKAAGIYFGVNQSLLSITGYRHNLTQADCLLGAQPLLTETCKGRDNVKHNKSSSRLGNIVSS